MIFKKQQLAKMLEMQLLMNNEINNDWLNLNWDFLRAAMVEGVEAIDYYGWKWWKKQDLDLEQLQIELVDIWHFYLSFYLKGSSGDIELTAKRIIEDINDSSVKFSYLNGVEYNLDQMSFLEKMDLFIAFSALKKTNLVLFFSICNDVELSFEKLYRGYICKNVLNIFRQKKGYKSGIYEKIWFGKEDNVWLLDAAESLDINSVLYVDLLFSKLEEIYNNVIESKL